ncbi:hypothetical protein JHD50_05890 [Sulfurimonas sp. MAG313]|nr:hypothetical protein [Sulfurimonas sp. MAG313]MDF1880840.1 hypothetical protein [Sulfurimonas sp. MAG313]
MNNVNKYANIQNELPKLQKVLLDAIQSEFLEIQSVKKQCEKYPGACEKIDGLEKAYFVVYSKYVKKADHRFERFIFLDETGHEVCDVSGQEMELYGLLAPCMNLELSKEYEEGLSHPV